MPKHGLTKEAVLDAAEELIEQYGVPYLTTGTLAKKLGIKPASLYNHIESTEQLRCALAERGVGMLAKSLDAAIAEQTREGACFALAEAYRAFVHRSPGLYHLILTIPMTGNGALTEILPNAIDPVIRALDGFNLTDGQKTQWQRILRAVMHGFSTQELWGFFSHGSADRGDTYRLAVQTVLDGIFAAEQSNTTSKEDMEPHD